MKLIIPFLLVASVLSAHAQIPVTDASVLVQVLEDVRIATEHLNQFKTEVERLGNPAAILPVGATEVINNLGLTGVGRTLDEVRAVADGVASLRYDNGGLYRAPGEVIRTADGSEFLRAVQDYRKFDAVTQAKTVLEDVMRDTEERRQQLRRQIQATTSQLQGAPTVAEVQKLHGVLTAQNSELAAIDKERDAAMHRLVTQHIENQTDAARQEQARHEEAVVNFRSAAEQVSRFLTPDTVPVRIPDPRTRQP